MLNIQRNISYNNSAGSKGLGDLILPDRPTGDPVLLIHGGGWNALSKEAMAPITRLFAERGRAVFNINYRLLDQAPWPACGDDCIAAGWFMLGGGLSRHGLATPRRLLICGASAGGHLAMMTGLGLPNEHVEAIISLAGPSLMDFPDGSSGVHTDSATFWKKFYGRATAPTAAEIAAVSPARLTKPGAPPLFCIHSRNDWLVPPSHSEAAVAAWHKVGSPAESIFFFGPAPCRMRVAQARYR